MVKKGFKTLSVMVKEDFAQHFEEVFLESGANSKGEFLSMLIESFINPDYETAINKAVNLKDAELSRLLSQKEAELNELKNSFEAEADEYRKRLHFYDSSLSSLYNATKGKTLDVGKGKLTINSPEDIQNLMVKSFKLK